MVTVTVNAFLCPDEIVGVTTEQPNPGPTIVVNRGRFWRCSLPALLSAGFSSMASDVSLQQQQERSRSSPRRSIPEPPREEEMRPLGCVPAKSPALARTPCASVSPKSMRTHSNHNPTRVLTGRQGGGGGSLAQLSAQSVGLSVGYSSTASQPAAAGPTQEVGLTRNGADHEPRAGRPAVGQGGPVRASID